VYARPRARLRVTHASAQDLEDIGSKISQLTMYDVRRAYTGALNWALNVSEMEAKVKEATSDEKWCVCGGICGAAAGVVGVGQCAGASTCARLASSGTEQQQGL
jgi:hypothetical protein